MTRRVQVSAGGVNDLGYHVVWCPVDRRAVLGGLADARCGELIGARASERGWRMLEIMPGHVHLFVKAHPSDSPSRVTIQFKGFTSRQLRAGFPHLRSHLPALWCRSYVAATPGAMRAVRRCIGARDERPCRKGRAR